MIWREYLKSNDLSTFPQDLLDKKIEVVDCLKVMDMMSFTIKELMDRKKWHTGKPTERGKYLIAIPKVFVNAEEPFCIYENSYELKICEYREGAKFQFTERVFHEHYPYSVDYDKVLWKFIDEKDIIENLKQIKAEA